MKLNLYERPAEFPLKHSLQASLSYARAASCVWQNAFESSRVCLRPVRRPTENGMRVLLDQYNPLLEIQCDRFMQYAQGKAAQ